MACTSHGASTSSQKPKDVPPTSRWCKRALRPLTAALLQLEKHWKGTSLDIEKLRENAKRATETDFQSGGAGRQDVAGLSDSDEAPADPTWVPGTFRRKRIKHRYSARNQSRPARRKVVLDSPEATKPLPGEFTIATPLISGSGQTIQTPEKERIISPAPDYSELPLVRLTYPAARSTNSENDELRNWLGPLLEYNEPNYLSIAARLGHVFKAFLIMTDIGQPMPCGARSLLSMSLSLTSRAMILEDEAQKQFVDKEDRQDVASRVCTELEDVFDPYNIGWKPLRELVRSHGIDLIREAIRRKWLSPTTIFNLVCIALTNESKDAAESLFSTWVVSHTMEAPDYDNGAICNNEYSSIFRFLVTYSRCSDTQRKLSFELREIGNMISNGTIGIDWMASLDLTSSLKLAMESIASEDQHTFASMQFTTRVVLVSLGLHAAPNVANFRKVSNGLREVQRSQRPKTQECDKGHEETDLERTRSVALSNSVASIMAILCSSCLSCLPDAATNTLDTLLSLSTRVQQEIELGPTDLPKRLTKHHLVRICHVLMAGILITAPHANSRGCLPYRGFGDVLLENFEDFLRPLRGRNDMIDASSSFVMQVVNSFARATKEPGFVLMKDTTWALSGGWDCDLSPYPILRSFLAKVAIDVGMKFAETLGPEGEQWVMELQEKANSEDEVDTGVWDSVFVTPSLDLTRGGFQWEESFGVWVSGVKSRKSAPEDYLHPSPGCLNAEDDRDDDDIASNKRTSSSASQSADESRGTCSPPLRRNLFHEARPKKRSWSLYVDSDANNDLSSLATSRSKMPRSGLATRQALHENNGTNGPSCSRPLTRDVKLLKRQLQLPPCGGPDVTTKSNACVNNKYARKPKGVRNLGEPVPNGDETDEEDDIFTSAPTLRSLLGHDTVFDSHPSSPSRMSRSRSKTRRLASSTSLPDLRVQHSAQDEMSDDELSFL